MITIQRGNSGPTVKHASTKEYVASLVLGAIGVLSLLSLISSFSALDWHEVFYRLGLGLSAISMALEPEVLFRTVSLAEATRPRPRPRWAQALSLAGPACFLIGWLLWLRS